MLPPTSSIQAEIAAAVDEYQHHGNPAALRSRLRDIAGAAMPDALITAAEPFRDIPEVAALQHDVFHRGDLDSAGP